MTTSLTRLGRFLSVPQMSVLLDGTRGEEKSYFVQVVEEMYELISKMPKTYETDGQGDKAVVVLHYFLGGCDWYITEKDMEDEQLQAFGLADLGYGGELGYISIDEITRLGAELDLHWTPKTIGDVKK